MWDEQNPVHFVGHSAGVQVVRVLHQMLADKVHKRFQILLRNGSSLLVVVECPCVLIQCFQRCGSCDLECMLKAPELGPLVLHEALVNWGLC